MTVQFSTAKNGEQTCSIDGKFLHSSYNPSRECDNFVDTQSPSIKPSYIIIIEPCLGLFCNNLRKKFPQSKLCAIRLLPDFKDYDSQFDIVFNDLNTLQDDLFNILGEEGLCTSHFTEWQNATRLFAPQTQKVWEQIKNAVSKSRNVLITRSHFSKRWLKNTVNFFSNVSKGYSLKKTTKPVIIACSGPSLETSIEFIRKNRDKIILIAVSSAIAPLLHYKIKPDLAISTDGGYWAKKHLEMDSLKEIPFAATPEGAYPSKLLHSGTIIPLTYGDGFENKYFFPLSANFIHSERNGTVSGTALTLALNWTENDIYLCGLDQASASGYQHTNPNRIEIMNASADNRITNKELRFCKSQFASKESLEIYRQWFESFSRKSGRTIYRLSDNYKYKNTLGKIQNVNWHFFESRQYISSDESIFSEKVIYVADLIKIKKSTLSIRNDSSIKNELFPLETLVLEHTLNQEEKNSINNKINTQLDQLKQWLSCYESKFNI